MKERHKKWVKIAALLLAAVIIYNLLEASAPFQHPEDAASQEVLGVERELIQSFIGQFGEEAFADFQSYDLDLGWSFANSKDIRSRYVPWALFKSRESQIEARQAKLIEEFEKRVSTWRIIRGGN